MIVELAEKEIRMIVLSLDAHDAEGWYCLPKEFNSDEIDDLRKSIERKLEDTTN